MKTSAHEVIDPAELDARLRRLADHEASMSLTPIGRALQIMGRTSAFAFVYRRFGPRLDVWLNRRFKGQVASRLYGLPALVLTTVGKKSGLPRPSPLIYVRDGVDFLVVGTNFGQEHHPAWTGNLLQEPRASVDLGPVRLPVTAKLVEGADFAASWPRFVAIYPGYDGYIERSGRTPRMFRLSPTAG